MDCRHVARGCKEGRARESLCAESMTNTQATPSVTWIDITAAPDSLSSLILIVQTMPVPALTDPSTSNPADEQSKKPNGQSSQKSMTKAERRELQEKQRAAKAALKAQGGTGQSKAPKAAVAAQKKTQPGETSKHGTLAGKDAATVMDDATGGKSVSRSLRIFKHFGLPKPVSHVKGDIHPAIIRLGLLFSEFKICGANARCIATLSAFKTVRLHVSLSIVAVGDCYTGHPRLYHTSKSYPLASSHDTPLTSNYASRHRTAHVSYDG